MADKKTTLKEKVDAELEKSGKINVKRIDKKSQEEFIQQIATRNLLEKDFGEDKLYVTFETKPGTKRTLEAKKPSWEEVMEIIKFSVEAKHLEGKDDADSMDRMSKIYEKLPKIAAQYVLDKSLDEKWWKEKATFNAMMNFIIELVMKVQRGENVPLDK